MAWLGALFIFGGLAALWGKPRHVKPVWAQLIYEEHKEKLLKRS